MHIAYVITRSDSIGGAHIHVRDLSLAMLARGHDVTVLVGGEGPFTQELKRCSIRFISLQRLQRPISLVHDICAVHELVRVLRDIKPDLISTHSSKAGLIGRVAGWIVGLPTVFTAHGWAFTDGVPNRQKRLYVLAEKIAGRFGPRIITVSGYDRTIALQYKVAPKQKLTAIHNGMPDVGLGLRACPDRRPPKLVMVARFEEQKDHSTLIKALAQLRDLEWTLELIGDGPRLRQVMDLTTSLELGDRVSFLGARHDVAERLAAAQVFLLISNWEGFPRSILEAMRAGLPVVASDVGGSGESVLEGVSGYLVPRGCVEFLRDRLRDVLTNPALRCAMGSAGRERFEEHFIFERMLESTLSVYQSMLHNGGI